MKSIGRKRDRKPALPHALSAIFYLFYRLPADLVAVPTEQDLGDDRCDSALTGQEPGLTDDRVICSPGWQQCNGTASENQLSIPLKMSELFDFRFRQCFRDPHGNK